VAAVAVDLLRLLQLAKAGQAVAVAHVRLNIS
jgi:hypothetical protein